MYLIGKGVIITYSINHLYQTLQTVYYIARNIKCKDVGLVLLKVDHNIGTLQRLSKLRISVIRIV